MIAIVCSRAHLRHDFKRPPELVGDVRRCHASVLDGIATSGCIALLASDRGHLIRHPTTKAMVVSLETCAIAIASQHCLKALVDFRS